MEETRKKEERVRKEKKLKLKEIAADIMCVSHNWALNRTCVFSIRQAITYRLRALAAFHVFILIEHGKHENLRRIQISLKA